MKRVKIIGTVFLVLVGLAFLNVAIQAFLDPQSVMDLVSVNLDNINARNSTRAYYGGVNLSIAGFCIYGGFRMQREALIVIALYGGGFVLGRLYSIIVEGQPNTFILTWLAIETVLTVVSLFLLYKIKKNQAVNSI